MEWDTYGVWAPRDAAGKGAMMVISSDRRWLPCSEPFWLLMWEQIRVQAAESVENPEAGGAGHLVLALTRRMALEKAPCRIAPPSHSPNNVRCCPAPTYPPELVESIHLALGPEKRQCK